MKRSAALEVATLLGVAALGACRRAPVDTAGGPEASSEGPQDDGGRAPARPGTAIGARCRPSGPGLSIDEGRATDVEVGDAVAAAGGYAVGLVHRTPAGRVAAVLAVMPQDAGTPAAGRLIDLGPTLGDAPPPRIVTRGADLVAAAYERPRAGDGGAAPDRAGATRSLALYALPFSGAGRPQPLSTIPQQRDDSFAFDLAFAGASGVVVWDEAAGPSRGVIRAAEVRDGGARTTHDVSPPQSDAELPRIVPDGAGFVVLWIARRPEGAVGGDASEPETPGEPRSFGWLEMVRVDERGAVVGPVRGLTQPGGHVSAYDVEKLAAPSRTLLVVARDDGEGTDGSGGALLRIRVTGDAVEPPVEFQTDGLGRGAPTFVDGPVTYLSWVGPAEQARLLPLDGAGAPVGPPSAEEAMNDARPLRVLQAAAEDAPAEVLVATPLGEPAKLRGFTCTRTAPSGN